jgi:GTP-binding protein HflX
MSDKLTAGSRIYNLALDSADGATMAWLHENGEVVGMSGKGGRLHVEARLTDAVAARFAARNGD